MSKFNKKYKISTIVSFLNIVRKFTNYNYLNFNLEK